MNTPNPLIYNDCHSEARSSMRQKCDIEQVGDQTADLLYGVPAIARYLGLGERQTRHLCSKKLIPTFKLGKMVCSQRSLCESVLAKLAASVVSS